MGLATEEEPIPPGVVQIAVKGIFVRYVLWAIACCRPFSNIQDKRLKVKIHFSLGPTVVQPSWYLDSQF